MWITHPTKLELEAEHCRVRDEQRWFCSEKANAR
ncbi:unnamed protein product [Rhodiola kirilowii]